MNDLSSQNMGAAPATAVARPPVGALELAAHQMSELIAQETLSSAAMKCIMMNAFGGSDAASHWNWRQAYDCAEAGALLHIKHRMSFDATNDPIDVITSLEALAASLPTQTKRSEHQFLMQQFSTPLPLAYLMAHAADIALGDDLCEPSAGCGALALMAQMCGAIVTAKELDHARAVHAEHVLQEPVTSHDAEFIADLVDGSYVPSKVLMNPPFSSTVVRGGDPTIALRHVSSALDLVDEHGLVVAILPDGAFGQRQSAWLRRVLGKASLRLHIALPKSAFAKNGTQFPTRMVVLQRGVFLGDSIPICHHIDALADALPLIAEMHTQLADLRPASFTSEDAPASSNTGAPSGVSEATDVADRVEENEIVSRSENAATIAANTPSATLSPSQQNHDARPRGGSVDAVDQTPSKNLRSTATAQTTSKPTPKKRLLPGRKVAAGSMAACDGSGTSSSLQNTTAATEALSYVIRSDDEIAALSSGDGAVSDVFASYTARRVSIVNAQAHPTSLVESLAMGSVLPPAPKSSADLNLALAASTVAKGVLSEAQLETLIMAETSFAEDLPGLFVTAENDRLIRKDEDADAKAYRRGFFLGDGAGCGKGRQVAGLILTGWLQGRRKALWVSKSATLIEDAKRDWSDLGGSVSDIIDLSKIKGTADIPHQSGILFCTYATLRGQSKNGARRLDQITKWLGDNFDGLIAFDEAHAMANAAGKSDGPRGKQAGSQQGRAGLELQTALPQARVLYVSATGATEVSNLAYAARLGLWGNGKGYPFGSREQFINAMEAGGVAAMEVVARDLKAMGLYTARALSFEGVEYDVLTHSLGEDQIAQYDKYAECFKVIHEPPHVFRRVKHFLGEHNEKEKTYPRLSCRAA